MTNRANSIILVGMNPSDIFTQLRKRSFKLIEEKDKLYPIDWPQIRVNILRRDKLICQLCRKKERIPHVHHILPIRIGGLSSPENLITLCSFCHRKVHRLYKRAFHLYIKYIEDKHIRD